MKKTLLASGLIAAVSVANAQEENVMLVNAEHIQNMATIRGAPQAPNSLISMGIIKSKKNGFYELDLKKIEELNRQKAVSQDEDTLQAITKDLVDGSVKISKKNWQDMKASTQDYAASVKGQ